MDDTKNLERVIEIASNLMAKMEEQAFQDERFSELSMRQMYYLNTITRLGHPTFSDLARELNVSKPSVTSVVGVLIRKGYVQKVQDPDDLRAYHIVLMSKAEEYNQLHEDTHQRLANSIASQLKPDEVEQLASLLGKALQGLNS
jgi:DNA-binding MarR family transcriptional regulator